MNDMKLSPLGARFIKAWEMLALVAYPDPASALGRRCTQRNVTVTNYLQVSDWHLYDGRPWTLGYGHINGVVQGQACDEQIADAWFAADMAEFEYDVNRLLKVQTSQCEFDALCSFAMNVGPDMNHNGIAEGLGDSTLLRLLNAGNHQAAADEFPKWNRGPSGPLPGLTARRAGERQMFCYNRYDMHNGPLIDGATGLTLTR